MPTPLYTHLPIIVNDAGLKLSKQNHAPIIDQQPVLPLLHKTLVVLGQNPPSALRNENLQTFWDWAITHWQTEKVPLVETCKEEMP